MNMGNSIIDFNEKKGFICDMDGVIDEKLNGKDIIAVPLAQESNMRIGYISHRKGMISRVGNSYLEALNQYLQ